jgi:cytochrome c
MFVGTLIGPESPIGLPAPYWFVVVFKVLGFTLHALFMNLWFAGIILAMVMASRHRPHARTLAKRLMTQMPIIIGLGVNLGIVPLLFTQVAYYRAFYPATILMAWPWLAIIGMLTVAYYAVYLYASGLRRDTLTPFKRAAGWLAGGLFLAIGFIFANGMSLMANVGAWPELWQKASFGGAATGLALNTADPTLVPRWLMMFGLALTTVAAWVVFDAAFFAGRESDDYARWAPRFAFKLATAGLVWFALTGSWYVFGTWQPDIRHRMFTGLLLVLTAMTMMAPGLPWLLILFQIRRVTRPLALLTAVGQIGVLGINAVSRQIVQNAELAPYLKPADEPVRMQWSPMFVFLVLFVAAIALVIWMLTKAAQAARSPAAE